ncbi:unnamed protein product [Linum tenue]|uniref:Uncharacterized protein n=1 Tax=Linum tenue TaxID=586396 RepID=A0AAV0HNP9_9ROSI|nr:unnamed protein product [Linum tenue]
MGHNESKSSNTAGGRVGSTIR